MGRSLHLLSEEETNVGNVRSDSCKEKPSLRSMESVLLESDECTHKATKLCDPF
jgi:hypothetical protein